jgi:hypothetical protein
MPREPKVYRNPPFIETDVLQFEECRRGLGMSPRAFSRVAPSLPVSYALGLQSPRLVWGEVVKLLKRTGAADAA